MLMCLEKLIISPLVCSESFCFSFCRTERKRDLMLPGGNRWWLQQLQFIHFLRRKIAWLLLDAVLCVDLSSTVIAFTLDEPIQRSSFYRVFFWDRNRKLIKMRWLIHQKWLVSSIRIFSFFGCQISVGIRVKSAQLKMNLSMNRRNFYESIPMWNIRNSIRCPLGIYSRFDSFSFFSHFHSFHAIFFLNLISFMK